MIKVPAPRTECTDTLDVEHCFVLRIILGDLSSLFQEYSPKNCSKISSSLLFQKEAPKNRNFESAIEMNGFVV